MARVGRRVKKLSGGAAPSRVTISTKPSQLYTPEAYFIIEYLYNLNVLLNVI